MRRLIIGLAIGSLGWSLATQNANAQQDQSAASSKPRQSSPSSKSAEGAATNKEAPPDILSGPKVEPEASQQRNNPGRPNANNQPKRGDVEIPFQQWVSAIRGLGLSAEQQEKGRAIVAEFQQATRDFQIEHGEEMRQLFGEMREARQGGKEPPKESREKMRTLEEARPKPDPYKERIWTMLNDQQQAQMKEKLDAMRKEMTDKRSDRRDNRRPAQDGKSGSASPDNSGAGPDSMNGMAPEPAPGDEMKSMPPAKDDDHANDLPQPSRPRAAAWRPSNNGQESQGLNALGRRRMEFLVAHQSANHRQGSEPSNQQKHFDFDESNSSKSGENRSGSDKSKP